MIPKVLFALSILICLRGSAQNISHYNVDSLLTRISENSKIRTVLDDATLLYKDVQLDTGSISLTAFRLAYMEKRLIDERKIHIWHRWWYKKRDLLTIIDFTKKGNIRRVATIDVAQRKLLFQTLVSQGSGKQPMRNDKYTIPQYFSNTVNSELSSLGLIATKKARQTETPCHLCKYAASHKHKDVIVLRGLEKGINDHVKKRDVVIHTTGSVDLGVDVIKELGVPDANYMVKTNECKCYRTVDGTPKGIAAYASACGIAENGGYIGQSNGCPVLPEDDHMELMEVINRKSLLFIYSDVETTDYSYFRDSPIIRKIVKYADK